MTFDPDQSSRHRAIDYVEPIGIFRCPYCAEVERENKELKEKVKYLEELLELERDNSDP